MTPNTWPFDRFERALAGFNRPGTVKLRLSHLRRFAALHPDPWAVTLEDMTEWLADHKWSDTTRRSHANSLRAFYRWARDTDRITVDPTRRLRRPSVPLGEPRPAPESVVRAALATRDERVRLMMKLAAQVGLRCCEIATVHSDDLLENLLGWSLRVHGKGGKVRIVPLTATVASLLRLRGPGYAFPGKVDGHLSAAHVSKLISRALPPGVTAHPLRHRFASAAYTAERDIRAVQKLLGHSSVATTQIYTAVPDDALRRAVAAAAL